MKKILVTGGLGFIGSHTVVELIDQGYEVVVADDLSNSQRSVLDRIESITDQRPAFYEIDLSRQELVLELFQKEKIDAVIHFAAFKAVGESVDKPLAYYRNNIASLVYLLEACQAHEVNHFVFSSSCTVYGEPDTLPVTERSPKKPAQSPYGNTKQIGEEIIQDFCSAHTRFRAIALRYFNPIGAHESSLIGELPIGVPANLVPFITQTAAGIRKELLVFGDDYDTNDGTCVRDYIHVVDLARAHISALSYSAEMKNNYDFFNVGTGNGYSVLEVIKAFERTAGMSLNYKIVDRRPGDVEKVYADTTKVNKELGWKAEKSLDEMMSTAWKWQQSLQS